MVAISEAKLSFGYRAANDSLSPVLPRGLVYESSTADLAKLYRFPNLLSRAN